jgi:ABC-type bacteriocin/lantibiotic exporter with double-glycine peptidase domain
LQKIGQTTAFLPDYLKAKAAVVSLFELFARKPEINNWSSESKKTIDESRFNGSISLESVDFSYPQRAIVSVLKNFTLEINKGQRIALVGSSGCGNDFLSF